MQQLVVLFTLRSLVCGLDQPSMHNRLHATCSAKINSVQHACSLVCCYHWLCDYVAFCVVCGLMCLYHVIRLAGAES